MLSIWAPRRHSVVVKIKCLSLTRWSLIDTHPCWIPPSGCHYMCTRKATNSSSSQASSRHRHACLWGLLVQELHPYLHRLNAVGPLQSSKQFWSKPAQIPLNSMGSAYQLRVNWPRPPSGGPNHGLEDPGLTSRAQCGAGWQ